MRAVTGVSSLLSPRSLVVVGASPRNIAAVETVVASGVKAWGVNPNRDEVAGLRCYPSIAELPEVPECAFLMVNHERVEAAFEEALAAGVRAFVVPGVGAEAGAAAKPTTERLAARAREAGAVLLGPNCMGFFVPDGPAAWNGRPQVDDGSGPCRRALPVGVDRRRVPLTGWPHRSALRRVFRLGGSNRRSRLSRFLRRGSGDASRRSLPRDGASARGIRGCVASLRRSRKAGRLPQGRTLRGRGPRGAFAYRCARGLGPRVLGSAPTPLGDRGRRLPRARRDARDPRPAETGQSEPVSEESRSRGVNARCSRTRQPQRGSPSSRSRRSSAPLSHKRSRTTSRPGTRSTHGVSRSRPRSTRARSSFSPGRVSSTSSSHRPTCLSSATPRTTNGAS